METVKALEILERKNYVRATTKLVEAVANLAKGVRIKMRELDVTEIDVAGRTLAYKKVHSSQSWEWAIGFARDCDYLDDIARVIPDLESARVGDGDSGYHMHGDFNAWITYPTTEDYIHFGLHYAEILETLSAIEAEGEQTVVKALVVIGVQTAEESEEALVREENERHSG